MDALLQMFNGFNMVVGDIPRKNVAYMTNRGRDRGPMQLQAGLHGFSNGSSLQQEWAKVQRGKGMMRSILHLQPGHDREVSCATAGQDTLEQSSSSASSITDRRPGAAPGFDVPESSSPQMSFKVGVQEPDEATAGSSPRVIQQTSHCTADGQQMGNVLHSAPVQPSRPDPASIDQTTQNLTDGSTSSAANPIISSPADQPSCQQSSHHQSEGAATKSAHVLPWDQLFAAMQDRHAIADDAELPKTGMPQHVERALSPIFIGQHQMPGGPYGTRTQTIIAAWHDGHMALRERNLQPDGSWQQAQHDFAIPA